MSSPRQRHLSPQGSDHDSRVLRDRAKAGGSSNRRTASARQPAAGMVGRWRQRTEGRQDRLEEIVCALKRQLVEALDRARAAECQAALALRRVELILDADDTKEDPNESPHRYLMRAITEASHEALGRNPRWSDFLEGCPTGECRTAVLKTIAKRSAILDEMATLAGGADAMIAALNRTGKLPERPQVCRRRERSSRQGA